MNVKRHTEFDPVPPCGASGVCSDCSSPWGICNKTVIIERQYDNTKCKPVITVVIVGEELGIWPVACSARHNTCVRAFRTSERPPEPLLRPIPSFS